MGLDAAAGITDIVVQMEAKADAPALAPQQAAWLVLVGRPAARRTRLAYIRKNPPVMVSP